MFSLLPIFADDLGTLCVFMRESLPPLFGCWNGQFKNNQAHKTLCKKVRHYSNSFGCARFRTVRFFLSFFSPLNHAFSLKFNYQSSNFLFLFCAFRVPCDEQTKRHTRRERKQNPQTQLTVGSHRSLQHLCTLRRLRTCSPRPHPTTAPPSSAPSLLPSFRVSSPASHVRAAGRHELAARGRPLLG